MLDLELCSRLAAAYVGASWRLREYKKKLPSAANLTTYEFAIQALYVVG
jgi:hypothetical protein